MSNLSSLKPLPDFGSAWSCVSDMTIPAIVVSGNRVVAEAIARRLQTPRGGLLDDPTYGFDVTDFVNDDLTAGDFARLNAGIQAECLKDQRVLTTDVSTSLVVGVLIVTIVVGTAAGPFTLVLAISDVTATLLQVTP